MKSVNKRMAIDLIEDAIADADTSHDCGVAVGLCGAFYMCGLLSKTEWEAFLARIPGEPEMFLSNTSPQATLRSSSATLS